MALETGTYISDLVATNPISTDPKSQGDDHIRLLKATVKATFPNVTGAVTATQTELNIIDGATLSTAELNILTGATLSTAELNILDGATLDVTELNRLDGITGAAAAKDGETYTGVHDFTGAASITAPDRVIGSSGKYAANLDYVNAIAASGVVPAPDNLSQFLHNIY